MEILKLIGNPEENFYQLGLRDQKLAPALFASLKEVIGKPKKSSIIKGLPWNILEELECRWAQYKRPESPRQKWLDAYASGLDISPHTLNAIQLLPDLISGIGFKNLACSTAFYLNEENAQPILHARLLDFPLDESYTEGQRAIKYQLKDFPEITSFGTAGLMSPSLTFMTSDMSVSLHQKFLDKFDMNGLSIFDIMLELALTVHSPASLISFLKKQKPISTWGIYVNFNNHPIVYEIDIGPKYYFCKEHPLKNNTPLYFANERACGELSPLTFPIGFDQYNQGRIANWNKKWQLFSKKNHTLDAEQFLQLISTPLLSDNANGLALPDTYTPTTISSIVMSSTTKEAVVKKDLLHIYYLDFKQNKLTTKAVHHIKQKQHQKNILDIEAGFLQLKKAQIAFSTKKSETLYQSLQMAEIKLKNCQYQHLAHFYFLVAEYLYDDHVEILKRLPDEFQSLKKHLPEYLIDHVDLFIWRIKRKIGQQHQQDQDNFLPQLKFEGNQKIAVLEQKIPMEILFNLRRQLIQPRIDIWDIIYWHGLVHWPSFL